ncbi:unnamed protein product [Rotaria sp. Silwood2]|nr:unnamed protein product [Rotaria sp. Silwood2]CAF3009563.1 unnamed protein product [Rotaria sp. Silwood2]CAF3322677.1 unnamed protein product [Rotaria sp. Silwood2]CAF4274337.1 unnamed protein product [Rotaria sp. Silwood2]CAF4303152.1 unnamed protein product [Rotaria sp. Silwood2]
MLTNCPRDTHECISPITKKIICLPVHQAGNEIVDCLGSTDEKTFCRLTHPKNPELRYKCWNEKICVSDKYFCKEKLCYFERLHNCSNDITGVISRLGEDNNLRFPEYEHVMIERSQTNVFSLIIQKIFLLHPTQAMLDLKTSSEQSNSLTELTMNQENMILNKQFQNDRSVACNRGIGIYVGIPMKIHCLCPPSYYGDRCQFQSQRVSLILQFSQVCKTNCQGIFGIIITLIDQDNIIHDHEQLTYTTTYKCENKFFIYLLYKSRPKKYDKNL